MRPYGDELLAQMRESLANVVTPSVSEDWPRYVAKAMELLLEHLELRWKHELTFLAEDTVDMRELFGTMRKELGAGASATNDAFGGVLADLDAILAEPAHASGAVELRVLAEENEAHREVLERALLRMDAVDNGDGSDLDDVRANIRQLLRRQLDRDVTLARPTFMHFGPTPRAT